MIKAGGVEWKVRLSFLVSVPPKGMRHAGSVPLPDGSSSALSTHKVMDRPTHLLPAFSTLPAPDAASDPASSSTPPTTTTDHQSFEPGPSISPAFAYHPPSSSSSSHPPSQPHQIQAEVYPVEKKIEGEGEGDQGWFWQEMRTELIECDVPITVFPPGSGGSGGGKEEGAGGGEGAEGEEGSVEFEI